MLYCLYYGNYFRSSRQSQRSAAAAAKADNARCLPRAVSCQRSLASHGFYQCWCSSINAGTGTDYISAGAAAVCWAKGSAAPPFPAVVSAAAAQLGALSDGAADAVAAAAMVYGDYCDSGGVGWSEEEVSWREQGCVAAQANVSSSLLHSTCSGDCSDCASTPFSCYCEEGGRGGDTDLDS